MRYQRYEYCQINGDACPCGRFGPELLKCKLPLSEGRMRELFAQMWEKSRENIDEPQ